MGMKFNHFKLEMVTKKKKKQLEVGNNVSS